MKTPEFMNPTVVPQQSPLVAVEVHETKKVGDGAVEEELLYHFFSSETLICCHSSSVRQKSYQYQRLDGTVSEALLLVYREWPALGMEEKNANSIQLWLLQSRKSNCCIAVSSCS